MQVGHAISVPDSEGSHLLPDDLGPGEPVSGLRPLNKGYIVELGTGITREKLSKGGLDLDQKERLLIWSEACLQ